MSESSSRENVPSAKYGERGGEPHCENKEGDGYQDELVDEDDNNQFIEFPDIFVFIYTQSSHRSAFRL